MSHKILTLLLVGVLSQPTLAQEKLSLEADDANVNLTTSVGRLSGNVLLKHLGMTIKGDEAESDRDCNKGDAGY